MAFFNLNISHKIKAFRTMLKKITVIYSANKMIKSYRTVARYKKLAKYYHNKCIEKKIFYSKLMVCATIEKILAQQNRKSIAHPKGTLRIFWVGANYEQDRAGLLQGLSKFGEVIIFKNKNGEYGPETSSKLYDSKRVERNSDCLVKQFKKAHNDGPVHLLIGQMWARLLSVNSLKEIQNNGVPVVNISMDDRHAFWGKRINGNHIGTAGLIPAIDCACTAAKECCLWYLAEGCAAFYFPEASNPEYFKLLELPKKYDVCFVGGKYGIRPRIINAIEKSGIKITVYGNGWPNGKIATEKIPELFASSKIVLGVGTIGYCDDFYALKMRDFDAPMSGSLYLTHHNPDLEELFEIGREIETYKSIDECVKKIHYYLENPVEREKIATAGRKRALRDHTWEKRFEEIFQLIGILKRTSNVRIS